MMRIRLGSVALAAAVAAALLMPGSAAAATRPTTFWLYLRTSCVAGYSSSKVLVDVKWRRAGGKLILREAYRTGKSGAWELCSWGAKRLKSGDVVRAIVDGKKHRLVIPKLKIKFNPDTDRVHGRAPAGSVLRFNWYDASGPQIKIKVGKDGRWSYSEPGRDIVPGDGGYARWKSGSGDTVTFENTAV